MSRITGSGKTTTNIQRGIPGKLLTHSLVGISVNKAVFSSFSVIKQKVRRHILYTLLHGRRVNGHIIIPRHTKVTNVIHLSRRIRRNLIKRRYLPLSGGIKASVTVPIKHHNGGPTSRSPNSIRRKGNSSALKSNLVKNHSELLVLRRSTEDRKQTNLTGAIRLTCWKVKTNRSLNLNNKISTISLLSSRAHIATRGSRRIRPTISCHIGVAISQQSCGGFESSGDSNLWGRGPYAPYK